MFSGVFISAEELVAKAGEVHFLDVRFSLADPKGYGQAEFDKKRIQGALFVNHVATLMAKQPDGSPKPGMAKAADFTAWCCANGVGRRPVVCYDDMGGAMAASRLWWMLSELGVEAYILDGGFQAYVAAGLPVAEGPAADTGALPKLDAWPFKAEWEGLVTIDGLPAAELITDARPADRFGSTIRPLMGPDGMAGHIPAAVNVPVGKHMAGGKLADKEAITKLWAGVRGDVAPSEVVHSCGGAVTACLGFAACVHAGLPRGKLYGGSWSEYCRANAADIKAAAVAEHGVYVDVTKFNPPGAPATEESKCTVDGADSTVGAQSGAVKKGLLSLKSGEAATLVVAAGQVAVEMA